MQERNLVRLESCQFVLSYKQGCSLLYQITVLRILTTEKTTASTETCSKSFFMLLDIVASEILVPFLSPCSFCICNCASLRNIFDDLHILHVHFCFVWAISPRKKPRHSSILYELVTLVAGISVSPNKVHKIFAETWIPRKRQWEEASSRTEKWEITILLRTLLPCILFGFSLVKNLLGATQMCGFSHCCEK